MENLPDFLYSISLASNDDWVNQYIYLHDIIRQNGNNLVKFFKDRLGRQNKCVVAGSERRRYYIWENDEWIIYAHNEEGLSFHIREYTMPEEEMMEIWGNFLSKILTEEEKASLLDKAEKMKRIRARKIKLGAEKNV